jgi:hypothetical protein
MPAKPISKSTEQIIEAHIKESVQFLQKIRGFIERQYEAIIETHHTLSVEAKITLMGDLSKMINEIGKNVKMSVDCLSLLSKTVTDSPKEEQNLENILKGDE